MKKVKLSKRSIFTLKLIWFLLQILILATLVFLMLRRGAQDFNYSIGDDIIGSIVITVLIFIFLSFSILIFGRLFEEIAEKRKLTKWIFELGLYCESYNIPLFLIVHNLAYVVIFIIQVILFIIELFKSIWSVLITRTKIIHYPHNG